MIKKVKIRNPISIIAHVFLLCFIIRYAEVLWLRLDESFLGENILHKLLGIVILLITLKLVSFTLQDIGFDFHRFMVPTLLGLGLGAGRFAVGYGVEYGILCAQGASPSLELFASGFSLTGEQMKLPVYGFLFVIVFNIINAVMEEGVFRGLFIRLAEKKYRFMTANLIAALFFGFWHVILPIRSYLDGTLSFRVLLLYSISYIALSGIISFIWGMLFNLSGVLWIGLADHFFNDAILNTLHVTTSSGMDELMIVRTMIAQMLLLVLVSILYGNRREKHVSNMEKIYGD